MTYQDDNPKTTGWEQQVYPALDLVDLDVVTGRDDTGFIQSAVQLNDNLSRPMIIDDLELSYVTWKARTPVHEQML